MDKIGNNQTKLLTLGAIGIVFGDIGTSPLYAFKECLKVFGSNITEANILGLCSLIFWSLMLVVSLKYIVFVMRANNNGEGGILSLMSLAHKSVPAKYRSFLLVIGLFGAATFYGDSVITPAISVLSAVEGLSLISSSFSNYILYIAGAILFSLFFVQKFGTKIIGNFFGPIMVLWFVTIAGMGIFHILQNTTILLALNPFYSIQFVYDNSVVAIAVFGAVFLALTGGEALYADMGHFGRKPISYGWFYLVLPSLTLNYFGQGALVLKHPSYIHNSFFSMVPSEVLILLVILSTLATIIASQAVISGAFSMTKGAIQLGYLPRLKILQTSNDSMGQIYLPFVNWMLFILVASLLFSFKTSDNLAGAYGIAVVTTMIITTIILGLVMKYRWHINNKKLVLILGPFFLLDIVFLYSNTFKIMDGGYLPLIFALLLFFILTTWKMGRGLIVQQLNMQNLDLSFIIKNIIGSSSINRTYGSSAVFLASVEGKAPGCFMHNLKHNNVLHENIFFLTIKTEDSPYIEDNNKIEVTELVAGNGGTNVYKILAHMGFMEEPNVPNLLKLLDIQRKITNWNYNELNCSFFLSKENIKITDGNFIEQFRKKIFIFMERNSTSAAQYFSIPENRVIELGRQICI